MKKFLSICALLAAALAVPRAGAQPSPQPGDGDTPIVVSDGSILVKFPGSRLQDGKATSLRPTSHPCWNVLVFTWRGGTPPAGLLSPVATYVAPANRPCPNDRVTISLSVKGASNSQAGAWRAAPPAQSITLTHAGTWTYAPAFTLVPKTAGQYIDGGSLGEGVRIASVQVGLGSRPTALDTGHSVIYLCDPQAPKKSDQCPGTINLGHYFPSIRESGQ